MRASLWPKIGKVYSNCIGWYATQIALGVCCICQAVYMLRTKMYCFKTTLDDANSYISQQLKCRRTCPIGWREHVSDDMCTRSGCRSSVTGRFRGEACYGSAVSTAESGSAPVIEKVQYSFILRTAISDHEIKVWTWHFSYPKDLDPSYGSTRPY